MNGTGDGGRKRRKGEKRLAGDGSDFSNEERRKHMPTVTRIHDQKHSRCFEGFKKDKGFI